MTERPQDCGVCGDTTGACAACTERADSRVHRDLDPNAVRGMWDIPHHAFVPGPRDYAHAADLEFLRIVESIQKELAPMA